MAEYGFSMVNLCFLCAIMVGSIQKRVVFFTRWICVLNMIVTHVIFMILLRDLINGVLDVIFDISNTRPNVLFRWRK